MSFELIPEGTDADGRTLYSRWSTWADGFVLEDATHGELREWAADAPWVWPCRTSTTSSRPSSDGGRARSHRDEDASEFLSGG